MNARRGPLVVIGVGNVLLRDDGVGVRVVEDLRRRVASGAATLPAATRLVDGGTLGLALLPEIDGARCVVLVDAADLGRAPGAVGSIDVGGLRPSGSTWPSPRSGVAGLLTIANAAGLLPGAVALVGVQPQSIDVGLDLTDVVEAAVPVAGRLVLAELDRLDVATRQHRLPVAREREMTGAPA